MRLLHTFRIINATLLILFCQSPLWAQQNFTIVLDAGHGGKDPGTVNGKYLEKDINLSIVKYTGDILSKIEGLDVIYTRDNDTFVELSERSEIAIKAKADLFVSVHVNATSNKDAYGTETFVMGVDRNNDNLGVAMRENGVISLENDFSTKYEGYDPNSAESHIMFSLMQYGYSQESLELAAMIQSQYKDIGRRDRGVKQAGFLVLWRNTMPSVLTEIGFLSNSSEMKYITSRKGQMAIGKALATSISNYAEGHLLARAEAAAQYNEVYDTKAKAYFSVQVRASRGRVEINSQNFGNFAPKVREIKVENMYKYSVGKVFLYKDALHLQSEIRKTIKDAFIVAYSRNGEQITVAEAKKILD